MDLTGEFEELFEDAPCGFLVTGSDGTLRRANRTFCELTGHRAEDLVGRVRVQDLLVVGDRIFYETHFAPLLALQSTAREIAVDFRRPAGGRLPALLNAVTKGDAVWICVFAATDRRGYERELLRARQEAEQSRQEAHELARVLQTSFVPPAMPDIAGIDLAGVYRPAGRGDEVGGDFYDVYETAGGWAVVLGDVEGKGVQAAVVTSLARYTLRAASARANTPSALLAVLNQAVIDQRSERFLTAVQAQVAISADGCRVTLALGGHPPPVHLTPSGPRRIGVPGTLLGVLPKPHLVDAAVDVLPGEAVVFYTDGVIEAQRGRELFGERRMERVLLAAREENAAGIAARLVAEVSAFQSDVLSDDVAVVVVKAGPADGASRSPERSGTATMAR
ncbi:PP2C family protein-serine/threonine phosphatase [Nonomuraea sp. NPDC047897]|uniref:PP2C family protein-serine/threonine phosphatase n=1 Tax=Nonomuraea sp. NPDC047897 TaxID=3364346 RepID=UPI00372100D5